MKFFNPFKRKSHVDRMTRDDIIALDSATADIENSIRELKKRLNMDSAMLGRYMEALAQVVNEAALSTEDMIDGFDDWAWYMEGQPHDN